MVHAIWLSDPSNWPPDTTLEHRVEIKAEGQVKRKIFSVAIAKKLCLRSRA